MMHPIYEMIYVAQVPAGMRPYAFQTIVLIEVELRKIKDINEFSILFQNILPMLFWLTHNCNIYASPQEMMTSLLDYLPKKLTYSEVCGVRFVDYKSKNPSNDPHAQFLVETVMEFVKDHTELCELKT